MFVWKVNNLMAFNSARNSSPTLDIASHRKLRDAINALAVNRVSDCSVSYGPLPSISIQIYSTTFACTLDKLISFTLLLLMYVVYAKRKPALREGRTFNLKRTKRARKM